MKIPLRKRHWLKEIEKAIDVGHKIAFEEGRLAECFYQYAQPIMMENRGITNKKIESEIKEFIEDLVRHDWDADPESRKQYIFHFVSSYLYAHVPSGYIDEMEADRIMEYINETMDLFTNA